MRVNSFIACILCFCCFACSPIKKTSSGFSASAAPEVAEVSVDKQNGTSFEKAIYIREKKTMPGIAAEYEWIRNHYPGSKKIKQRLIHQDKKSYDIITIEMEDGEEKDIYFDITGFFGK